MMKHTQCALAILLASSSLAFAEGVNLRITIKNHRFQPSELRAPSGQPIALRVINADPTPEEFESKDLRVERVIPGNGATTFQLRPLQPGRYRYFGEFNEATATGFLIIE